MLSAHDLSFSYDQEGPPLWRPLSFDTGDARMILLSGDSGCGKSTLLRILCGLLPGFRGGRLEGRVSILGSPAASHPDGRVGLLFQNTDAMLHSPRVSDELLARAGLGHRDRGTCGCQALRRGWLAELVDALELSQLLDRPILDLSGGEQQRVTLAAVLAACPEAVLLDEPTSNLDDHAAEELGRVLQRCAERFGTRFIISEHRADSLLPRLDAVLRLSNAANDGCSTWSGEPGGAPAGILPAQVDLRELRRLADSCRPDSRGEPLLDCRNVSCTRGGRTVLEEVSLTVRPGEIIGLSGPNGAGKSTLLLLLAGGLKPTGGSRVLWSKHRSDLGGNSVGLLLQNPMHQLFCETVREEVALAAANTCSLSAEGIGQLLEVADLAGLADRPCLSLSYGEQQRTALAAAMSARPPLVLLDEPTHGTDASRLARIIRFVIEARRSGTAFIVASHHRSFLDAFSDRVLTLHEGRLAESRLTDAEESQRRA